MFKAIYIDTTAFYECQFDLFGGEIGTIAELAELLGIELWSSDIALSELQIGMRNRVDDLRHALHRAQGVARYFDHPVQIPEEILDQAMASSLKAVKRFFVQWSVRQLCVQDDLDESDIAAVFSDYFNSRRCFSGVRKRSEFPDAFQFQMILRNVTTGEELAILSNDKDFESAFRDIPNVTVFPSPRSLIATLNRLRDDIGDSDRPNEFDIEARRGLSDLELAILVALRDEHESFPGILEQISNTFEEAPGVSEVLTALDGLVDDGLVSVHGNEEGCATHEHGELLSPETIRRRWFVATALGRLECGRQGR